MSKSVDETVFDYFSVLLAEPSPQVEEVAAPALETATRRVEVVADVATKPKVTPPVVAAKAVTATVAPKPIAAVSQSKTAAPAATPAATLDKQALERLLSSVVADNKEHREAANKPQVKVADVKESIAKVTPTAPVSQAQPRIVTKVAEKIAEKPTTAIIKEPTIEAVTTVAPATQTAAVPPANIVTLAEQLDEEFQVLFFKVAGLTLAVPLVSLGGIVQIEHINHIIGRPKWFKGVQTYRESQLNVVDTAAWVMPEKYDEKLAQSINYQYLVVLENSNWGLACETLLNAVKINKSQVNWRAKAGKRPWLAGVVKEQMCGILHVQALMEMLNAGLGCQDPIN